MCKKSENWLPFLHDLNLIVFLSFEFGVKDVFSHMLAVSKVKPRRKIESHDHRTSALICPSFLFQQEKYATTGKKKKTCGQLWKWMALNANKKPHTHTHTVQYCDKPLRCFKKQQEVPRTVKIFSESVWHRRGLWETPNLRWAVPLDHRLYHADDDEDDEEPAVASAEFTVLLRESRSKVKLWTALPPLIQTAAEVISKTLPRMHCS